MSYYESVFITRQELGDKEIEKLIQSLKKVLEKNEASIVSTEFWGLRNLAYKIEKNKKGHYVMIQIEGSGKAIEELERNMRIDENIIRYLSLKIDKISDIPSIMVKKPLENSKYTTLLILTLNYFSVFIMFLAVFLYKKHFWPRCRYRALLGQVPDVEDVGDVRAKPEGLEPRNWVIFPQQTTL